MMTNTDPNLPLSEIEREEEESSVGAEFRAGQLGSLSKEEKKNRRPMRELG